MGESVSLQEAGVGLEGGEAGHKIRMQKTAADPLPRATSLEQII